MGKFDKAIAGFVGFATAVTMSFGTASAMTTEEMTAMIATLQAQIAALQMQSNTTTTVGAYTFSKDLTMGSTGVDVMNLQKVLNSNPSTVVATTGVGSAGMETTTFGAKTKAAVIKFQVMKGLTPSVGYVGPKTRSILNTMGGSSSTTTTTPTGTEVSVALSFDNPAAGTIIAGQAIADLAHFTFSNPTGAEAKITKLVFNRTGISNDSTLANVYLFDGATRVTDAATVSQTKVTFNDASGLFTIPAGGMKTIAVKSDIAGSTSGQIIGVSLAEVTGSASVKGAFPILGNNHSVAQVGTMAAVAFGATTPSAASIDPQTGYVMWQNTLTVSNRTVNMGSITFKEIGSVATADIGNFQMTVDGVAVGTAVASMNANGYITFAFPTPVALVTGSHTLKVTGDVIGGSNKNFKLSLQQAGDVTFIDSQLGQPILSTGLTTTTAGQQSISQGTLTITKKTDSPAGNLTKNASNVTFGKFEIKAAGEPLKVENLLVNFAGTGALTLASTIRNGALFANGVQVGNTVAIIEDSAATPYTTFNLGSSLIVTPGTPVILEVRGDVYSETGGAVANGDTITVGLYAGSTNVKRMQSLDYISNTAVVANTLTVAVGNLSASKNTAYASQTIVVPKTAFKIGAFNIISTDVENLNLDTLTVALAGVDYATNTTDLYVKYGTKTSSIKSTVTASNVFNISETLVPNTTMAVEVYATLGSNLGGSVTPTLTIAGTAANSSTAVSATSGSGQVISVSTGSIGAAVITDSTLATKLLVGNSQPKVASFRFTSVNDTYTITDIAVKATTSAGAITSLVLKSAGMADKLVFLGSGDIATSSGMTLNVPANSSTGVIVDVYLNLNDIASNAGTPGSDVRVVLDTFKANTSGGTPTTNTTDVYGNDMYVYKTIPTVTLVALPSTALTAGTKTLMKYSVAADAAGALGWKKIVYTMTKASANTVDSTTLQLVDSNNNVIAGTFAEITGDLDASGSTTVVFSFVATDEQQLTTTETYQLKGNVTAAAVSNTAISTAILTPSSYAASAVYSTAINTNTASFVWTDRSLNSHSVGSADWNNDYKVKNLPTDSQTLTVA